MVYRMKDYLLWGFTGGMSGGVIYFMGMDIYTINIRKTQIRSTPVTSINQLCNYGLFIGLYIGINKGCVIILRINLLFIQTKPSIKRP